MGFKGSTVQECTRQLVERGVRVIWRCNSVQHYVPLVSTAGLEGISSSDYISGPIWNNYWQSVSITMETYGNHCWTSSDPIHWCRQARTRFWMPARAHNSHPRSSRARCVSGGSRCNLPRKTMAKRKPDAMLPTVWFCAMHPQSLCIVCYSIPYYHPEIGAATCHITATVSKTCRFWHSQLPPAPTSQSLTKLHSWSWNQPEPEPKWISWNCCRHQHHNRPCWEKRSVADLGSLLVPCSHLLDGRWPRHLGWLRRENWWVQLLQLL